MFLLNHIKNLISYGDENPFFFNNYTEVKSIRFHTNKSHLTFNTWTSSLKQRDRKNQNHFNTYILIRLVRYFLSTFSCPTRSYRLHISREHPHHLHERKLWINYSQKFHNSYIIYPPRYCDSMTTEKNVYIDAKPTRRGRN